MKPQREDGLTLVELLLVVAMIGIVTAIAVPFFHRARTASLEASTVGSLRTLISAQATFAATCAGGFFAPTIASLSTGTGNNAFIGAEFRANTVDRFGYRLRFTAGPVAKTAPKTCNGLAPGTARQSYFMGADPLQSGPGQGIRHFGTGPGATIFQSTKRVAAFYSGVPPPPAMAIR